MATLIIVITAILFIAAYNVGKREMDTEAFLKAYAEAEIKRLGLGKRKEKKLTPEK